MDTVLIIAGEKSGDHHGSALVRELLKIDSALNVFGIGGPSMRDAGVDTVYDISQMGIIGIWEVVKHLPFIHKAINHLKELIETKNPKLVILIDYPGFNLKIAQYAHSRGIKVLYYISPQVWAWGSGRIKKIAKCVDHMAVIFDFEQSLFSKHGIQSTFVGHPLLESVEVKLGREEFLSKYNLPSDNPILGLFPGSREQEIQRNLPEMVKTAHLFVQSNPNFKIGLSLADNLPIEIYAKHLEGTSITNVLDNQALMRYSALSIVASGTSTLESVILNTPFVVVYRVSPITYWIIKKIFIRIENISLVNIVAGKLVVPEFIQYDFKAEKIAPVLNDIMKDEKVRNEMCAGFELVRQKLGTAGASARVAKLAASILSEGS